MAFYDLAKEERVQLTLEIKGVLFAQINTLCLSNLLPFFNNEDTYIRKSAYISLGRIYFENPFLQNHIIQQLFYLFQHPDFKVRQTLINAAGEIGKQNFEVVQSFFDKGLFDEHYSPRNAVIGSIKKMGEVNPKPVLAWAATYLNHPDKEIRREICHGIELRGRTHPQDILPLLKTLQFDTTARVRNTLVHVIGQIAYKKGCLAKVITDLNTWENQELVNDAIEEIIDVHYRYRNFSDLSQDEAIAYIATNRKQ